ncbi:hypothetical protein IWW45_008059 [Coemansia sp. RSA 485]|nr:hypothetical protein IWW45_008059 [Coemansia sp. RSA 485]
MVYVYRAGQRLMLFLFMLLPVSAQTTGQRQRVMAAATDASLVTARGTRLWRGHAEYHVSGANYWQAMNLAMASGESSDRARVHHDLSQLQSLGINTVRILASSEGSQFNDQPPARLHPVLMPRPGYHDPMVLHGLDWFLAQLPRYNMTAVVSLANYWTWSGGAAQLVGWATDTEIPYPAQWDPVAQNMTSGDYQRFLEYANRFFDPEDSAFDVAQQIYRHHVTSIVGRMNLVTGRAYASDPTILAWELMNEPQRSPHVGRWVAESAQLVRALDPHHLVTPGAECKDGAGWFHTMHSAPDVSLASCHFWAANWGLYNASDPTPASLTSAIGHMQRFVADTAGWAHALGLPVALMEYGLGRDAWGKGAGLLAYQPETPATHRDAYFAAVCTAARDSGYVGTAFWAYAGEARPPKGPSAEQSWTGDPPHEPAGWNSVFDRDASTLDVIRIRC